jgi:hypothetical protein
LILEDDGFLFYGESRYIRTKILWIDVVKVEIKKSMGIEYLCMEVEKKPYYDESLIWLHTTLLYRSKTKNYVVTYTNLDVDIHRLNQFKKNTIMKKHSIALIISVCYLAIANAQQGDLPPNAQPNSCYAKPRYADEYEEITEQVLVKPERKKTVDISVIPCEGGTEQVLIKPAIKKIVTIPAEYENGVLVKSSFSKEITIPAEYRTNVIRAPKVPPIIREITIPAEYKTVTYKKLVRKQCFSEWQEVFCESKLTPERIKDIQAALIAKGYDAHGKHTYNEKLKAVLRRFQIENHLPLGFLDRHTFNALGIPFE